MIPFTNVLFVYTPYSPDIPDDLQEFAGRPLSEKYLNEILESERFVSLDCNPEEPVKNQEWKLRYATAFLDELAETFGFSVDKEKLTFEYSEYKVYKGLNKVLEHHREKLRPAYITRYLGFEALADSEIFARFGKDTFGIAPMISGGYNNVFFPSFYEALYDGCENGNTYQITQILGIRPPLRY